MSLIGLVTFKNRGLISPFFLKIFIYPVKIMTVMNGRMNGQKIKLKDLKTIDIEAKEWRDKVNGNSYFSSDVILNYGMNNKETIKVPFQYGYGDLLDLPYLT